MNKKCTAENFAKAVADELVAYNDVVTEKIKRGIDKVSLEAKSEIAAHAPKRTGKYLKAFRIKKAAYEDKYNKRNVWYVAKPYYRLTHLLEHGYLAKDGTTRVKARPHIIYGEELTERRMIEIAKEAAKP